MMRLALKLDRGRFSLDADCGFPLQGTTGVFGPSGAGKTTLLRCIAGLEPDAVGTLQVGESVWQNDEVFVPPEERRIGYVFQEPRLFAHLTVGDNITFGYRRRQSTANVAEIVELLGVDALLDRAVTDLSGGEAQRVSIARALASAPDVLLMDEPLASVDTTRRAEILPFLDRLQAQSTTPIVYVSHNLDEICHLCDALVVMENGQVTDSGDLQDVLLAAKGSALSGHETSAVIDTEICGYDDAYALTTVRFSGGEIVLPGHLGEAGKVVRLRVNANDISLCRDVGEQTTILNRLDVVIEEIQDGDGPSQLIRLKAGEDRLLARVTRRSVESLSIAPGEQMTAQLKAVAIRES